MRLRDCIVLLLLLAVAAVTACAPDPLPQDHYYRLQVGVPQKLAAPRLDGVLEVQPLAVGGLLGGRPIVHSVAGQPLELREYHYHLWVEPPTAMLHEQLVAYVRAAGLARTTVTPEIRVEPDFVLGGRIMRLEQVLGPAPGAEVELELSLRAVASDRLLLLESYRQSGEARDSSVAAAVEAINLALRRIYDRFAADVAAL